MIFSQNKSRNNQVGIVAQLNNKYQNNKTVFIVIGVVALFFVVVGLYYFYHYVKDRNVSIVDIKEVIDSVQDGQEEMEVGADKYQFQNIQMNMELVFGLKLIVTHTNMVTKKLF